MTSASGSVGFRLLVVVTLIAAGLVETFALPSSSLISAPFAIPILISARWLSPTETLLVTLAVLGFNALTAYASGAPLVPVVSELSALAIVGYLGVQLDVQRQETEQHARAAEAARKQVMSILDSITDAYVALRPDGTFSYLNRAAAQLVERYLHCPAGELLGRNIWQIFPEMVDTRFYREFRRTLAEGRPAHYEEYYAPLDVWLEVHAYPYQGGVTAYVRDVTARKQAEEEESRLLAYEQALAEIAQTLVREVELSRVVEVVIEDSLRVLGVDAVAVWLADPGRRALTLLAARGKSPLVVQLARQLDFEATSLAALVARTGQIQVVDDIRTVGPELALTREIASLEGFRSLVGVPLVARGHLVGVVVYASRTPRHVGERQLALHRTVANLFAIALENARLFDQIRQELRRREEFLATVGHELRTPVTVIKGRAQLLLRSGQAFDPHTRGWIESIVQHADQIADLIEDLLEIGRIRLGQVELTRTQVDLAALVRDRVEEIARRATQHRFDVEAGGPLPVEADPSLIRDVLEHLLAVALQYAPRGSPIRIVARPEAGQAAVSIHYPGPGIAPERLPHVFEPFYELVPPGEPGYVGSSSAGLYVSKEIIEAHGGRLRVTSAPGQETTFTFQLPLARSGD